MLAMADAARAAGRQLTSCDGRRRTRRRGPPHRITRPPVRHVGTRPALTGGIRRRAHCRERHHRKPSSPHRARDERDNPQQHQPGRDTGNATERARPPTVLGDEHRALARVRRRLQSGVALALADQLSRLQCHLRRSHFHTPFNAYEPPRSEGRQDRDALTRSRPFPPGHSPAPPPTTIGADLQPVPLRVAAVRPDRARRRSRCEPGPDQTATQAAALAYNASGSPASAAAPAWDDEAERTVPVLLIDDRTAVGAGAAPPQIPALARAPIAYRCRPSSSSPTARLCGRSGSGRSRIAACPWY
jgi:hypothetical protein